MPTKTRSASTKTTTKKKTSPKAAASKRTPAAKKKSPAKKTSKAPTSASTKKKASGAKKPAARKTKAAKAGDELITIDRRKPAAEGEPQPAPAVERRKKVQRRRQIDPTTCERDYTDQEVEFMNAMDEYKRKSGRMFPTCSEVLEVIRDLGYVKLTPAEQAAMAATDEGDADASQDSGDFYAAGPEEVAEQDVLEACEEMTGELQSV